MNMCARNHARPACVDCEVNVINITTLISVKAVTFATDTYPTTIVINAIATTITSTATTTTTNLP